MDDFTSLVPLQRRSSSRIALLLGIALSLLCLGIGCGDFCLFCDDAENSSPQAVASPDKTTAKACEKDTVTLDGTESSDPDGDPLTYQWEFTQRPEGSTAAIQNATESKSSFQPDEAGSYTIELAVEDESGLSSTDSIEVTAGTGPVADAGDDQRVSFGETVTLDGGNSANPEEECTTGSLSFSWSLSDPDGIESDLGGGAQVEFSADKEGTYTATLDVVRGSDTDSDEVDIEVGESALQALQSGPYEFTVEAVNDEVFGGLLQALEETTLGETVDIPSTDEVPVDLTIALNLGAGVSVDLDVTVLLENAVDEFYTLNGDASGSVSVGVIQCELAADCTGQMTPESTTAVVSSLTLSNPEVTGSQGCSGAANEEGTIELTLRGTLQQAE